MMGRLLTFGALLILAACSADDVARGSGNAAGNAIADSANWATYGGTYEEQRFSPADAINADSVSELGLAWSAEFDTARGQQATPLAIDGVLYTTTAWSKVFAFDAETGKELWRYDPKVPGETGFKACCDVVNRGPAYDNGRIFVGTLDGRLIALDARTGKLVWSTVTVDQSKPYTITGAPRVVKGRVLIGNGGGEYGVRGYVSAYDTTTGKLAWRFYTVPAGPGSPPDNAASDPVMTKANTTWFGDWGELGGGGTVWDSIVYDVEFDQVLIGTGNGSPWPRELRSQGKGDNLFISSIVALDATTGAYKWHYQGTPGEEWDFTQTQTITLTTLKIDGADRKVLLQAPKNGYFYVIDRRNGKLVSAKGFVPQNWTTGIDMKTGRPVEAPGARYRDAVFVASPSGQAAHNWHPMAYSPQTKLAYIPTQEIALAYKMERDFKVRPGGWNLGIDLAVNKLPDDEAELEAVAKTVKGYLLAWDPVTQTERWRVPHTSAINGGVLATAGGLVFQGNDAGNLVAYAAATGKKLWSFDAQMGIVAPPISYSVKGKQYVAVMAGYGGAGIAGPFSARMGPRPNGRLLVFALGADAPYKVETIAQAPAVKVAETFSAKQVAHGAQIFETTCSVCHGPGARSSGVIPDLRRRVSVADKQVWHEILINGALKDNGMVSFAKYLSPADAEATRAYVAQRADILAKQEQGNR